jgi:HAD superfamily hydrolase (TIGR01509 family)
MVDVALFELEGVLFDTRKVRLSSLRTALLAHGIGVALDSEVIDGLSPRAAAAASLHASRVACDDVLLDLIAHRAERAFSETMTAGGAKLRGGAGVFMENAASQARLAIVTRMARADAEPLLRLAALESIVTLMICGDDVLDAKPAPDGHRAALERLGRQRPVELANVISLEDGASGIRAAHAAGIRCIAVGPIAADQAMEADAFVDSIAEHSLKSLDELSSPGQEHVQ